MTQHHSNPHPPPYRGRLAPTPSGFLHLGHARTFWTAFERARHGKLILRVEDIDLARCRPEYAEAMLEDLRWLGIEWHEGPDYGGPHGPYRQRDRLDWYREVWRRLAVAGAIYPSPHSRKDVERALRAPHEGEEGEDGEENERIFPPELRPAPGSWEVPEHPCPIGRLACPETEGFHPPASCQAQGVAPGLQPVSSSCENRKSAIENSNWRFRVPDGEAIRFVDELRGPQCFVAGRDFGDFLVWRRDGWPAYELAVVADDCAMGVTEVVRGEDLLLSTARQLLLYRALGWAPPAFCHAPLVRDVEGRRLAKRADAVSLRELRNAGLTPEDVRRLW